ncbi:putative RNA-binding protein [Wickerhamomyces ciferrii]|uniref:U1 small nuclear ribonucleoprotein component SNU71 n=1 Tax=Wickerhamomyces ciferrii (strain ATCC 14091 / BCRC 22168 / CBS 111 / JCM 3599 / NBRC 0793 / NRRL Y-1031 F-60-10) TaxID=1206466 RepID=K0KNG0_WICCF|nr:putative RNA-binding protein [Wickerhamomyces ciferrii]CCH42663.1 putative RNA-binding protein [Wickerhamomyces ciferrii]
MPITEEEVPKFKPWLVKRAGELSDADPSVLADYVVALLNNKVEGDELVKLLDGQLEDFLDDSKSFAFEIVNVLNTKAYEQESAKLTGAVKPSSASSGTTSTSTTIDTQGPIYKPDRSNYRLNDKKKRTFALPANHQHKPDGANGANGNNRKENLKSLISQREVPNAKHLIVANLPADKLDEQLLRSYFSRFGAIDNVLIDLTDRIAEIEFANPNFTKKAWTSPAPIFDNRFIKVFYRKKDAETAQVPEPPAEEEFDLDEFKQKQLERQKQFEERLAKKKEHDAKIKELIAIKERMLGKYEQELKELELELQASPEKEESIRSKVEEIQTNIVKFDVSAEGIALLKNKLNGIIPPVSTRARGSRGRGAARGGIRGGRGGFNPYQRPRDSTYNRKLDFRTRTVTIKNISDPKNEALNKYLKTFGEENVSNISTKDSGLNITFNDRFHAERFLSDNFDVENIGKLEKEWDESVRPTITPPPSNSDDGSAAAAGAGAAGANSSTNDVEMS